MPTITIHNLSAETHRALQAQAKAAGRSTEAEVRHILDQVVLPPEQRVGLGTLLAAIGQKYGGVELNIEREYEDRTPDFS
ncbi:antitoxin [uncultured Cardiobacterium sp.]|uniref:FitA-like ribbon-helix-helix domain-containing protein n=1 Tax=uncultured Cardiobacterium sp. TaxID=417619 RepID=UPI0026269DBE|nr:antitoxin [uncultured Cardiobacterium sp.]